MSDDLKAQLAGGDHAPVLLDVNVGETKRKREVLEELATHDIAEYRCPECGETYPDERLVRVHATRSMDEAHRNANGFLNFDVEALSPEGDVVGTIPPAGNLHKDGVMKMTPEDLPDTFSEVEKVILLTACKNANVQEYSKLNSLVNQQLSNQNLDPVDYNKTYRLVKEYFDRGSRRSTQSKPPEEKTYEDLTESQQAVLLAKAYDSSATQAELAQRADVDISYPPQVLSKYDHVLESLVQMDETELPENDLITMPEQELDAEWDDLTDTQKDIIDAFAKNPGATNKDVSDGNAALDNPVTERGEFDGCAVSYPSRIKGKFKHLIEARREHFGITDDEADVSPDMRTTPATNWDELTASQQKVAEELLKEDDPLDPDRTHKEIAQATADPDDPDDDGVHATYIGDVIRRYGDLITTVKEQMDEEEDVEEVIPDQPVTGNAAKPLSASPYDSDTADEVEDDAEETPEGVVSHQGRELTREDMFDLDYRTVQEIAKARDIRADEAQADLIQSILEHEGIDTSAETEAEPETSVDEAETESDTEPVPTPVTERPFDELTLSELSYRDLQKLAKERDIKANQEQSDLIAALEEYEAEPEEPTEPVSPAQPAEPTATTEAGETASASDESAAEELNSEVEQVQQLAQSAEGAQSAAPTTIGDQEGEMVSIPKRELQNALERAHSMRRTAEREASFADGLTSAHGRLAAAEEWETVMNQLITRYSGETSEESATATTEAESESTNTTAEGESEEGTQTTISATS